MKKIFVLTAVFFLGNILSAGVAFSQNKRMLLFEIDGNRYKRQNYDENGKLESFQILNVGSIQKHKNDYQLPVEIISFNQDKQPQDTTKTIYKCNPDEQRIFVNIFPYSDYGKGGEIKVKPEDTNSFYPVNPTSGWKMGPIHFEMKINKGIVGFLGGKSKIKMYDRHVLANDTLTASQYEIDSKVELGVYVMGIKVKSLDYRVMEIIDHDKGIIRQRFTAEDGSYFVIKLI